MTKKLVDWTKPIQTVEGGKARFLGKLNNNEHDRVYVVAVSRPDGEYATHCDEYGNHGYPYDIINVLPKKIKVWINLYKSGTSVYYSTKAVALDNATKHCLDTIEIEVPEGADVSTR